MVATQTRNLITEGNPDAPYPLPPEQVFGDADYWLDSKLESIGEALIRAKFHAIIRTDARVAFLWKKKGGTASGNATLGKCIKLTGPAAWFANGYDYLVWCAADHARIRRLTNYQVEALLYHELLHIEIVEPEDSDAPPIMRTRGHDFEGFEVELREYGRWEPSLETMAAAFQTALPFLESPDQAQHRAALKGDGGAMEAAAKRFVSDTFRDGSGIDSVTFSTPQTGESVTITREDAQRIRHGE